VPDSLPQEKSLRSDNPAERVTPGQDDAAMVHHLRRGGTLGILIGQAGAFYHCATAGGTPIRYRLQAQYGAAVAANTFHA
jgi:hypothetical protein